MRTPPHVVAFRTVIVTTSLLILLGVALGLAGLGPASGLQKLVNSGVNSGQAAYTTGTGS
jgi:hypothetical protein